MTETKTVQFVGPPCGRHGPYTFYKTFKYHRNGRNKFLSLGEFFFVKISKDIPLCIGELQLLWEDINDECVLLASVRLYFLPESTAEGRLEYHGRDELLAENQKIVLRVQDLLDWIVHDVPWNIGLRGIYHEDCIPIPDEKEEDTKTEDCKSTDDASDDKKDVKTEVKSEIEVKKEIQSEAEIEVKVEIKEETQENDTCPDQVMTSCENQKLKKDSVLPEVKNNHRILRNSNKNNTPSKNGKCQWLGDDWERSVPFADKNGECSLSAFEEDLREMALVKKEMDNSVQIIIISFPQYCRYRAILKRLENVTDKWLLSTVVRAIGGFSVNAPNTRILFCRDTVEHPELLDHEYRLDHLAPNLKGRPRKKKKFKKEAESDSNDSEYGSENSYELKARSTRKAVASRRERLTSDEKRFMAALSHYMKKRGSPISRVPNLGFKQVNIFHMYSIAQKMGGYDKITEKRLWKVMYDKLGGNPGSTSAATCTRRHYEKLLLPFERYVNGEEAKPLPEPYVRGRGKGGKTASSGNNSSDQSSDETQNNKMPGTKKNMKECLEIVESKPSEEEGGSETSPPHEEAAKANAARGNTVRQELANRQNVKEPIAKSSPNHMTPDAASLTDMKSDSIDITQISGQQPASPSSGSPARVSNDSKENNKIEPHKNGAVPVTNVPVSMNNRHLGPVEKSSSIMFPMNNRKMMGNHGNHQLAMRQAMMKPYGFPLGALPPFEKLPPGGSQLFERRDRSLDKNMKLDGMKPNGATGDARPSVIQHTPKPKDETYKGLPLPSAHMSHQRPPTLSPYSRSPLSSVHLKRPYPGSTNNLAVTQQYGPTPPAAHSSHRPSQVHLDQAKRPRTTPNVNSLHKHSYTAGLMPGSLATSDQPMDFSKSSHALGTSIPAYALPPPPPQLTDAPLNLVTHRRKEPINTSPRADIPPSVRSHTSSRSAPTSHSMPLPAHSTRTLSGSAHMHRASVSPYSSLPHIPLPQAQPKAFTHGLPVAAAVPPPVQKGLPTGVQPRTISPTNVPSLGLHRIPPHMPSSSHLKSLPPHPHSISSLSTSHKGLPQGIPRGLPQQTVAKHPATNMHHRGPSPSGGKSISSIVSRLLPSGSHAGASSPSSASLPAATALSSSSSAPPPPSHPSMLFNTPKPAHLSSSHGSPMKVDNHRDAAPPAAHDRLKTPSGASNHHDKSSPSTASSNPKSLSLTDYAAAHLHPAFPSFAHMLPGALTPQMLYDAHLRTNPAAASTTPPTSSSAASLSSSSSSSSITTESSEAKNHVAKDTASRPPMFSHPSQLYYARK